MELYGTGGSNTERSINYTRSRGRARGGAHQFRGSSFRGSSRGSSYRGPFQRTDNTRHPLPNRDNQHDKTHVKDYRKCKNCGGSHGYRQCPAYGLKCKKCFEYNHFASMCYSGNKPSHVGLYYNGEKDYGEENIDRNCFYGEYKNYYYDENDCYKDQIDLSEQLQKVKRETKNVHHYKTEQLPTDGMNDYIDQIINNDDDSDMYIYLIESDKIIDTSKHNFDVTLSTLKHGDVKFKIDTGADASVISRSVMTH